MTLEEWQYVLFNRITVSGIRYSMAQVNNVNGLVLLPDDWNTSFYTLNNTNEGASYNSNVITVEQWNTLEQHGAIFLPAAGLRMHTYSPETGVTASTYVFNIGFEGNYWSSSCESDGGVSQANGICFFEDEELGGATWFIGYRYYGNSVRLVQNVE